MSHCELSDFFFLALCQPVCPSWVGWLVEEVLSGHPIQVTVTHQPGTSPWDMIHKAIHVPRDMAIKGNSNTLATSCEELTHWKRPWCWEGGGARGEGDDRGWDGWMASPTRWTWVWVISGSWWWTGRPGVLRFMGSQRVGHDWATELNWTELRGHLLLFWLQNVHIDSNTTGRHLSWFESYWFCIFKWFFILTKLAN